MMITIGITGGVGAGKSTVLEFHEEKYQDYTSSMIDQIYAYKEALPENKHFVEINHTETLAQIFTDIRYKKADNEFMSEGLKKVLKRQGFDK